MILFQHFLMQPLYGHSTIYGLHKPRQIQGWIKISAQHLVEIWHWYFCAIKRINYEWWSTLELYKTTSTMRIDRNNCKHSDFCNSISIRFLSSSSVFGRMEFQLISFSKLFRIWGRMRSFCMEKSRDEINVPRIIQSKR